MTRAEAGRLAAGDAGRDVLLQGWVAHRRDFGELVFVTLRDRSGVVQVLFDENADRALVAEAKTLRAEDVVEIRGSVARRAAGQENPAMATGEIEVVARTVTVLNRSDVPPFAIEDRVNASEDLRLKYRYLDLRRPVIAKNFLLRDEMTFRARKVLHERGFLEVETPILTKSTPEGARDFLVPARNRPGEFYALPQSPQLFKQLLMVAGFDRYYQIARCFRDEDLRADRQPEFTQIDVEMAFATPERVFELIEALFPEMFGAAGVPCAPPFPRLTYDEAIERFGIDRPDLRFGMELVDLAAAAEGSGFVPFERAFAEKGWVRGLRVPGGSDASRKKLDEWADVAKTFGAGGLVWIRRAAGELASPAKKALAPGALDRIAEALGLAEGDLGLVVAGAKKKAADALANLRVAVARDRGMIDDSKFAFCWVTDFPLVEWDERENRWFAMHHPFTSPREEDLAILESDPGRVRARAYDVVLNGTELGGGSIRIHRADVQSRMFRLLGIGEEEARAKFGFLLDAFRFGAPPHGGIALGVDRICMLAAGASSIRDVIAFPKTASGACLMTESPSPVSPAQLAELGLALK
ncbi:MAG TPA: aspartate--tRNA ligase [Thermoanaerobaculia bacterium]|nr:aspartate--tRNA ligase [Thermoanaerobaculia bacterium]